MSKNSTEKSRGFTLIELLVVISIIGLIASLAALAAFHYKDRANDARIKTDLGQIRTIAARIDNEDDSYMDLCKGGHLNEGHSAYGNELEIISDDIERITGEEIACHANSTDFCVQSAALTTDFLCIDSTGYLGKEGHCPGGNNKCAL